MKADVHPAEWPQLDIPPWVPDVIAQFVGARYAADVDRINREYRAALRTGIGYFAHAVPDEHVDELVVQAAVASLLRDVVAHYRPLVADRRMEGVWRELSRPRRGDGAFLHPALPPFCQDEAMVVLFNTALGCQGQREATTTKPQAEQQRDYYLGKAAALLNDAAAMQRLPWRDEWLERDKKLVAAAQAYQTYAGEVYATSSSMALKRKHDGRARWVALTIGGTFHMLFGLAMYTSTATITSVILGREIEPRTVQQWLTYPAVKSSKITP